MFQKAILILFITGNLFSSDNFINLKNGFNSFINKNNKTIDVQKTFNNKYIKEVIVFDEITKQYAKYPFSNNKKYLQLKAIEKNVKYKVYSSENTKLTLIYKNISNRCQELLEDTKYFNNKYNKFYNTLEDSGIDRKESKIIKDKISISSRYYSNQLKGIYGDSKVILIYPNLETKIKSNLEYQYAPALPKVIIKFSKEYKNKKFYIYDFFQNGCYEGYFPSKQIPPFRELRKVD
jgi:hypothetical protein